MNITKIFWLKTYIIFIKATLGTSKDELLEKFFDELKDNPNNTVETQQSEDETAKILETAFIMLDFQKGEIKMFNLTI